jgi:phospholipid/cholesterol/gamma-HCH transport system ATP-binding protein
VAAPCPRIEARGLSVAAQGELVQRGLDFEVAEGTIFAITGDAGSGKSLLLRHLVGLERPAEGEVLFDGDSLWTGGGDARERLRRRCGVLFQGAGLLSGATLLENVALKLRVNTALSDRDADEVAAVKLALLGVGGHEGRYPFEVGEAVRARAAVARATALDPELLFFDEPTAGLDPLGARRVDDLILELRERTGATVVLASIDVDALVALADNAVFLDSERRTMIARGRPSELRDRCPEPKVRDFLTRGRP